MQTSSVWVREALRLESQQMLRTEWKLFFSDEKLQEILQDKRCMMNHLFAM